MLIPLIAMDKINLIEKYIVLPSGFNSFLNNSYCIFFSSYIGEEERLQEKFVMLLDRLCGPGTSYKHLLRYVEVESHVIDL